MHVLWLSESPDFPTGFGSQTFAFGREFVRNGHDFTCMAFNNPALEPYMYNGIAVYPYKHKAETTRTGDFFRYVLNNIVEQRGEPDVFVVFLDIRFVEHVFSFNEFDVKYHCPFVLYHLWDNGPIPVFNESFYSVCDAVICGSKFAYNLISPMIPEDKLFYVSLGSNPFEFYPLPESEIDRFRNQITSNIKGEVNFIMCSTNANIHRKRLADLIEVYEKFATGKDDVALLMHCYLDDPRGVDLTAVYRALSKNNKKRYLIASTPRKQGASYLNLLYNFADVTVNIAHSEGFGMQTIESMLAGTPPVVSAIGNHPYMVEDAGWLIDPSASRLTGGIGAQYIYEHYVSVDDTVEALNECYYNRDVLQEKASKCRNQGLKFNVVEKAKELSCVLEQISERFSSAEHKKYRIAVV